MEFDPAENPFPDRQDVLAGDERDRLVGRVLETTDLDRIDRYVREQGYDREGATAFREPRPEYSFAVYRIGIQYSDGGTFASALWTGLHPDALDAGEVTYEQAREEIVAGDELEDTSVEERDVLPLVVGFLRSGAIGLSVGSDGVEAVDVDWEGFAEIAAEVDPNTDC